MEQGLVVGARVEHELYGEGVIVENYYNGGGVVYPYLVQFNNKHTDLRNGYNGDYPVGCTTWFNAKEIKLITPAPKSESQQLIDILMQLGFVKLESTFDHDYVSEKLNVYWMNSSDPTVLNRKHKNKDRRINKICGHCIATNIAYFQKKIDKKIAQTPKQVPPTQELVIHIPDNVGRVKLVTNLSNLIVEVDNIGVQQ
jgi:hypothetical protein